VACYCRAGAFRSAAAPKQRLANFLSARRAVASPAQVGSRVGVLWGVLWIVPEVRTQQLRLGSAIPLPWGGSFEPALDVAVLVVAWSVSEIIRYTFYFCKVRCECFVRACQACALANQR
jgi:hypothetical protein